MKKHLANIVSSTRIVGAAVLFCLSEFSPLYLAVYCFCGFTDFIDGPIARKFGTTSALGAALDTIGDVLTYLSMVKVLLIQKQIPGWLLIWLGINIIIGFVAAFYAQKKFHKFYLPHSYLGKSLGGIIFMLPLAMQIIDGQIWMAVICAVMSLVLAEIFYIQAKSTEPQDFVATIFHVNKPAKASEEK